MLQFLFLFFENCFLCKCKHTFTRAHTQAQYLWHMETMVLFGGQWLGDTVTAVHFVTLWEESFARASPVLIGFSGAEGAMRRGRERDYWKGRDRWGLRRRSLAAELIFRWPLHDFKKMIRAKCVLAFTSLCPANTTLLLSLPSVFLLLLFLPEAFPLLQKDDATTQMQAAPTLLGCQELNASRHWAKCWHIASLDNGVSFSVHTNLFVHVIEVLVQ